MVGVLLYYRDRNSERIIIRVIPSPISKGPMIGKEDGIMGPENGFSI